MATVTLGNNIRGDIAEFRDSVLSGMDETYLGHMRNVKKGIYSHITEKSKRNTIKRNRTAEDALTLEEYLKAQDLNRLSAYYSRMPAEKIMTLISKYNALMEVGYEKVDGKLVPVDAQQIEDVVTQLLLALEDAQMGREKVREPIDLEHTKKKKSSPSNDDEMSM